MDRHQISRFRMIEEQILARGCTDPLVLDALASVPRHCFVPGALASQAYADCPLPIGFGQTISQPYIVAVMSQLLEATAGMRVLEIGTGSGYQAAILQAMGLETYTVERIPELYEQTARLFLRLRYHNIRVKLADGTCGWPEAGPFERIMVTAGGPGLPRPLLDQLADPGRLVIPMGKDRRNQHLVCVEKIQGKIVQLKKEQVSFVDLIGLHGW